MKDNEIFSLALNSVRHRSLRSWLAILGIVIGVASVVTFISISMGLNSQVQQNLGGLGGNLISISAGGERAGTTFSFGGAGGGAGGRATFGAGVTSGADVSALTFNQAQLLEKVQGVEAVDARLSKRASIEYKGKNSSMSVVGSDPKVFEEIIGTEIDTGRMLEQGDRNVAVLGNAVQERVFGGESMLGRQVKIDGQSFRIVGILKAAGLSVTNPDSEIFIPINAAQDLFDENKNADQIIVAAADGYDPEGVAGNLTAKLDDVRRVNERTRDFSVRTASSITSAISSITDTLGMFLVGIASISLIVGGVGVSNAMFTSVLEQTRYIGVLKALGAKNIEVIKLFLFESVIIGLAGGLIGIAISLFASGIITQLGLPSKITIEVLLMATGFSIIIGAVSGLFPARRAASVLPVESLRYE
ncbi:MAG: ABC transporter permease [Candidatus Micrarchaeota archaeon]